MAASLFLLVCLLKAPTASIRAQAPETAEPELRAALSDFARRAAALSPSVPELRDELEDWRATLADFARSELGVTDASNALAIGRTLLELPEGWLEAEERARVAALLPHPGILQLARAWLDGGWPVQARLSLEAFLARPGLALDGVVDATVLLAQACGELKERDAERALLARAEVLLPGLGRDELSYYAQIIAGQRIDAALEKGRQAEAWSCLQRLKELSRAYSSPGLRERNLSKEADVYLGLGEPGLLLELLEPVSDLGDMDPRLSWQRGQARIGLARKVGGDLRPGVLELEAALTNAGTTEFALVGGLSLIEGWLRLGQVGDAQRALDQMRQRFGAFQGRRPDANRWRRLLLTLELLLAWRGGASPAELSLPRAALEREFAASLREARSAPPESLANSQLYAQDRALPALLDALDLTFDPEEGPRRALERILTLQALTDLGNRRAAATLADLRANFLGEDEGILLYHPVSTLLGESIVFAFDGTELSWARIGDTYRWEDRARELRTGFALPAGALDRKVPESARALAREHGGELVPPEIAELAGRWRRWTVVGLDAYGEIPFDGLEVNGLGVLGLCKEIEHVPNLAWALDVRKRVPGEEGGPLFVCPSSGGDIPPAAWRERVELDWDMERTREGEVRLLSQEATRSRLHRPSKGRASILTILAHGRIAAETSEPQIQIASEDGSATWLSLADVPELPPARFVLLGVCQAGSGAGSLLILNSGQAHFGGRFLEAGSEGVLLGIGDLFLEPTSRLFGRVHREMLEGQSLSGALLVARRELVDAGYAHPAYHALVKVHGLGHGRLGR